jgi:hypothetical protein
MAVLDPSYDPRSALYQYAPGVVLTRAIEDAIIAQFIANGNAPLTQGQVLAITGTPPTFPSTIKKLPEAA